MTDRQDRQEAGRHVMALAMEIAGVAWPGHDGADRFGGVHDDIVSALLAVDDADRYARTLLEAARQYGLGGGEADAIAADVLRFIRGDAEGLGLDSGGWRMVKVILRTWLRGEDRVLGSEQAGNGYYLDLEDVARIVWASTDAAPITDWESLTADAADTLDRWEQGAEWNDWGETDCEWCDGSGQDDWGEVCGNCGGDGVVQGAYVWGDAEYADPIDALLDAVGDVDLTLAGPREREAGIASLGWRGEQAGGWELWTVTDSRARFVQTVTDHLRAGCKREADTPNPWAVMEVIRMLGIGDWSDCCMRPGGDGEDALLDCFAGPDVAVAVMRSGGKGKGKGKGKGAGLPGEAVASAMLWSGQVYTDPSAGSAGAGAAYAATVIDSVESLGGYAKGAGLDRLCRGLALALPGGVVSCDVDYGATKAFRKWAKGAGMFEPGKVLIGKGLTSAGYSLHYSDSNDTKGRMLAG